jgi:serine/threonine protein kinase
LAPLWIAGIVSGMTYLHTTLPPVLHNDLKTANVLIGSNFQAKLANFGLSMKKKSNGYLGTPFWMAPELLNLVNKCKSRAHL